MNFNLQSQFLLLPDSDAIGERVAKQASVLFSPPDEVGYDMVDRSKGEIFADGEASIDQRQRQAIGHPLELGKVQARATLRDA